MVCIRSGNVQSVIVDMNSRLVVSDYNNHQRDQCFRYPCDLAIDHCSLWIHTMANLNYPLGTALDPRDSSVYVANYDVLTVLYLDTE